MKASTESWPKHEAAHYAEFRVSLRSVTRISEQTATRVRDRDVILAATSRRSSLPTAISFRSSMGTRDATQGTMRIPTPKHAAKHLPTIAALTLFGLLALPMPNAWSQTLTPGPEFPVNAFTVGPQTYPAAASTADGRFVVVWQSDGQDGSGIYGGSTAVVARTYDKTGSAVTGDIVVNTFSTATQSKPDVSWDAAAGNFVVVWSSVNQEGPLSGTGIFGQRLSPVGAKVGTEFQINTFTPNSQDLSAVAASKAGGFVVVWESNLQDGSALGIFGQRFDASGVRVGTEFQANTFTLGAQGEPAVAADAAGNFVVVWRSVNQEGPLSAGGVFGQRYSSSGARLGTEFRANTETVSGQDTPSIACDDAGNFIVAWESNVQDGSSKGVYAQRFANTGLQVGTEFRVNTYTLLAQDDVSVSATPGGSFVVAWESADQDGDPNGTGVFAQRYAADGGKVGTEFQVNTYTTQTQGNASVALDQNGNFVIAWESNVSDPKLFIGQDGSDGGIFAKRFTVPAPAVVHGDCNANGLVDAGDPICAVLCLLGTPSPGADCDGAGDCNCNGFRDAGDPICSILRLLGTFSPDSCLAAATTR